MKNSNILTAPIKKQILWMLFTASFVFTMLASLASAHENNSHADNENITNTDNKNVPMPTVRFIRQGDTATSEEPEREKPKVIIKMAPGVELNKINENKTTRKNYQRAVFLLVEPDLPPEQIQQEAEKRCRYYGERQRKDYFVNIINKQNKELLQTVLCKDVEGATIADQERPMIHPVTRALEKPLGEAKPFPNTVE